MSDTLQSIFDTSCRQIISQGGPSGRFIDDTFICKYRGADDRQCAAGPFLTDAQAEVGDLDRLPWMSIIRIFPAASKEWEANALIADLQSEHDGNACRRGDFFPNWLEGVRKIAAMYNLDASVLDEYKGG